MEGKKIALVTCYHKHNYGSQLQAYATQRLLDGMGIPNETICIEGLRKEINRAKYWYFLKHIFDLSTVRDKWGIVLYFMASKVKGKAFRQQMGARAEMFRLFASEMFHFSTPYASKKELGEQASKYLAFVVGSDQLWLPSNIEADYYTLNFVPDGIPKISFATSFGVSQMPKPQRRKAASFLMRLDAISVRELSGEKIVEALTGKTADVVCDPTMLFTAQDWLQIQKPERMVKEQYVFCYFLGNNPVQRAFAKRLSEKTGLKIVQLQHVDKYIGSDSKFPDYAPCSVGPAEFISLIRDAAYVLTDSFHGTVFSLLYKKPFFAFKRYSKDTAVSTNSRLYSLLSLLNLESFLLTGQEPINNCLEKAIDYKVAHAAIAELRTAAIAFVKRTMNECGIGYDTNYK